MRASSRAVAIACRTYKDTDLGGPLPRVFLQTNQPLHLGSTTGFTPSLISLVSLMASALITRARVTRQHKRRAARTRPGRLDGMGARGGPTGRCGMYVYMRGISHKRRWADTSVGEADVTISPWGNKADLVLGTVNQTYLFLMSIFSIGGVKLVWVRKGEGHPVPSSNGRRISGMCIPPPSRRRGRERFHHGSVTKCPIG